MFHLQAAYNNLLKLLFQDRMSVVWKEIKLTFGPKIIVIIGIFMLT